MDFGMKSPFHPSNPLLTPILIDIPCFRQIGAGLS